MRIRGLAALAAIGMGVTTPAGAQPGGAEQPSAAQVMWQVRSALNVAALGCRGPAEGETIAAYNALLASEKAPLAAALTQVDASYKARWGAAWQARFDDDATRAYNHWATPTGHDAFCAEAETVLRDAATVEPSDFATFAAAALPRLEAAFAPPAAGPAIEVAETATVVEPSDTAPPPAIEVAGTATAPSAPPVVLASVETP